MGAQDVEVRVRAGVVHPLQVEIVGPGLFTLGAAAGHLYQMATAHNFAPGNAGVIFYMDILIPLFGFALLWLQHRSGRSGVGAERTA